MGSSGASRGILIEPKSRRAPPPSLSRLIIEDRHEVEDDHEKEREAEAEEPEEEEEEAEEDEEEEEEEEEGGGGGGGGKGDGEGEEDVAMAGEGRTGAGPGEGGEFDFSEVFGPSPSPHPHHRHRHHHHLLQHHHHAIASISETGPSFCPVSSAAWAMGAQSPARILTRSHSLVGPSPSPSPRHSLVPKLEASPRPPPPPPPSDCSNDHHSCHDANLPAQEVALSISDEDEAVEEDDDSGGGGGGDEKELLLLPSSADPRPGSNPDRAKRLGPHDFKLLRIVGQGAFGKVFQVQEIETQEIFAMKVMRKDRIVERNHGEYMKAERNILTKIVHPFIVQLRYSFQTKAKLYLILDFINGGHLFFQLYRQGTFSEELARVYTAEIVSAVAHLHKNGIIHRDLKPENILLDAEGHVKLTDFGLAKEIDDSKPTNSMCGTVEYMAPEIVSAKGHGKAADWWSVGILLFEMLTGQPPFTHNNRQKLQQKIVKDKIKLPPYLTSEAHSLLKGLLQKEPSRRLGYGASGSDEIKQHKWFKAINWRKLEAREIQPKFRPEVKGQDCIANFDERWTKMPAHDSPASTPKEDGMGLFRGYTYVAPNTWLTMVEEGERT